MTTADMVSEVQAGIGNRSDFKSPNVGYDRIFTWLNWSQYELAGFHKHPVLAPRRFHCLEDDATFATIAQQQLVAVGTPGDLTAIYINNGPATVDYYRGWVVATTGYTLGRTAPQGMLNQVRVIRSYEGAPSLLAHVWPAWNVAPDAFTYITLYKRVYTLSGDFGLDPLLKIWTVERMEFIDDGTPIVQKPWVDLIGNDPKVLQKPGSFGRRGSSIVFDVSPDKVYYIKAYYYMFPPKLVKTDLTTSPIFPEFWHQVIVEGAIWWGFSRLMEPVRAAEKRQEWIDLAGNKQDEYSIEAKHEMRGARMRFHK